MEVPKSIALTGILHRNAKIYIYYTVILICNHCAQCISFSFAHILNAEGEKLQYVLGTLKNRVPVDVTICDIMAVNKSVHKTLRDVVKAEMLLQLKLEDALELDEDGGE